MSPASRNPAEGQRTCDVVIVWTSSTSSYDTVTRCTSGNTSSLPVVMLNTSRTGASACTVIVWISGAHANVQTWQAERRTRSEPRQRACGCTYPHHGSYKHSAKSPVGLMSFTLKTNTSYMLTPETTRTLRVEMYLNFLLLGYRKHWRRSTGHQPRRVHRCSDLLVPETAQDHIV